MFWYENDILELEKKEERQNQIERVLFYGSSSMRLWSSIKEDFSPTPLVNLAFGGSTLAACVWYFERVLLPYKPKSIILYAGDNDLGDGRTPEEVVIFFQQFHHKVRQHFCNIPLAFMSVKPSIARWNINDRIVFLNKEIKKVIDSYDENSYFIDIYPAMLNNEGQPEKSYFEADGLHVSKKGYEVWKNKVLEYSDTLLIDKN